MDNNDPREKILTDYRNKADKIIKQMFSVLIRAHRKVDDLEYRKALEKIHQI